MRKIPSYTWESLLDEPYIRTLATFELMQKEDERERKAMEKARKRKK